MNLRPALLLVCAPLLFAQRPMKSLHPTIEKAITQVSEERIAATLKKFESFQTRDANGVTATATTGIAAARAWLEAEFKSYSPRLEVRLDPHAVKKGGRFVRDVDVVNVVAVLKGKQQPEVEILVGAHYDTIAMVYQGNRFDAEATAAAPRSPGVADNASGVALVLELARVLSQYEFDKTLVFIAFAGEEQGLIGSRGYAEAAAKSKERIEALINVDVIGNDVTGNGIRAGQRVNVYSPDPADSGSRALARYMKETSERYLPELTINPVFRADRFGRGGDHTPFNENGFSAVRVTTPTEQLEHQHNDHDTYDRVSVPFCSLITRGVGAALSALAYAPKPPVIQPLTRGQSHYDAVMRWKNENLEPDLAGYAVVVRSTLAPFWEREIYVGKTEQFTLKNVSIDEVVLGVKAVDNDGVESLVSAWTLPPRRPAGTTPTPAPAR